MANTKIYFEQGGSKLVVGEGGILDTTNGTTDIGPVTIGVDGVATENIQDGAVTTDKLDDEAVTTAKLAADSVDETILADGCVITDAIQDEAVTFAKSLMFVSAEQTGTGMEQSIAHGLGVVPSAVLIVPTDTAPMTAGDYTAVEGVHTNMNVLVTVTADKKYKVWAMG